MAVFGRRFSRSALCSRVFVRTVVAGVAAAMFCSSIAGTASAQKAEKKARVIDEKSLTAGDGWPLQITYFKSAAGKEAPAVILLHMQNSNRLVWRATRPGYPEGFAGRLQEEGYAVVSLDLRKHGQSKGTMATAVDSKKDTTSLSADDYQRMALDLDAVKDFLLEEHQAGNLNIRKTAIVAPGFTAPIAINFSLADWLKKPYDDAPTFAAKTPRGQDIRAIVLLSPEESVPGVNAGRAILDLRNPSLGVSFLIAYGTKDKLDRGDSRKIHQKLASLPANKDRMYLQGFDSKMRGTEMLGERLKLEETILGFLKKHLADLPDEWRDRKSRLSS